MTITSLGYARFFCEGFCRNRRLVGQDQQILPVLDGKGLAVTATTHPLAQWHWFHLRL